MTTKKLATEKQMWEVMGLMAEGDYETAGILYKQYTTIPNPPSFWDRIKKFLLTPINLTGKDGPR